MAEHHCRVIQDRPEQFGGTIELATGVRVDEEDTVHLTLLYPANQQVDMTLTDLEQNLATIAENTGWTTTLTWDD